MEKTLYLPNRTEMRDYTTQDYQKIKNSLHNYSYGMPLIAKNPYLKYGGIS